MKEIKNQTYSYERALYMLKDTVVSECRFEGKEDGESPFKEAENIVINSCYFALRYACWHVTDLRINFTKFDITCRAPLWYCDGVKIANCESLSPKALRESKNIYLTNSSFVGNEFGWKCNNINVSLCHIESEYAFLLSKDICIDNITFKGKYSFQYVENMVIRNSKFDTKDAFWHSKNVTIYDSEIKGEYIAWYAENITFINCKISGTQPFCYTKGVKLIHCELIDADLAFEYSEVDADVINEIISIKNPKKGRIVVKGVKEIINKDSKYLSDCEIIIRK